MTDDGQAVGPPKRDVAVSPAGVMATAIDDLEGLAALGPNWDGYGSAPPTDLARRRARSILDLVCERFGEAAGHRIEPDTVAAMPGSGVLLEWRGDGAALEVDIGPGGEMGYLSVDRHDGERRTAEGEDAPPATIMGHLATVLAGALTSRVTPETARATLQATGPFRTGEIMRRTRAVAELNYGQGTDTY